MDLDLFKSIDLIFDQFSNDFAGITIKIIITIVAVMIIIYGWRKITHYLSQKLSKTKSIWDDALLFSIDRPLYLAVLFLRDMDNNSQYIQYHSITKFDFGGYQYFACWLDYS